MINDGSELDGVIALTLLPDLLGQKINDHCCHVLTSSSSNVAPPDVSDSVQYLDE